MKQFFVTLLLSFAIIVAPAGNTNADWLYDGTPFCSVHSYQEMLGIIPDGAGGAIITWWDSRDGDLDIYAQRIDAMGTALWAADGVPVCTANDDQREAQLVSDGSGGCIIVWNDNRAGNYDIYAQRLDENGTPLWTADGVAISAEADNQHNPRIVEAPSGGAIIVWSDRRSGSNYDIYAQKINSNGSPLWTAGGLAVCLAGGDQTNPDLAPDGSGGAFIVWADERVFDFNIFMQWILSNGSNGMGLYGVVVCSESEDQTEPRVVNVGSGYMIIAWNDARTLPDHSIYAQKADLGGTLYWTAGGEMICDGCLGLGINRGFEIIANDDGGAFVAWYGGAAGVYASRLDRDGVSLWGEGGTLVCASGRDIPRMVSNGNLGIYITYSDDRNGYSQADIYAQELDQYGICRWDSCGVPVSTAPNEQISIFSAPQDDGGLFIAWSDYRLATCDIFAQRINADGSWGYPYPGIHSILDVPGDQGGWVNMTWDASVRDPLGEITHYTIWRALDAPAAALMIAGGAMLLENASEPVPGGSFPVIRRDMFGGAAYYWEMIDSHDAYYLEEYAKIVPTAFDSSAVSDEYQYFQVIAHTSDPFVFWVSEPDSGYSVDNIAPCPPLCLAGEQSFVPEGLMLTWDPNTELDLDRYTIYRGVGSGFTPGPGNRLTEPCDTFYFDGDWSWDSDYCYKVTAVDVHGNESEHAVLCSEEITGGETPAVPQASFLAQNVPNPFNPATAISFGLAEPGHVSLKIYDAEGRLVRVLVDEHRTANRYEVTWNGRNSAGSQAASGVYFYKINAGAFEKTKKMVLLR